MVNGWSMDRLAHRVASVMSARPARRRALMARLRRAAMILGRDRVLACDCVFLVEGAAASCRDPVAHWPRT